MKKYRIEVAKTAERQLRRLEERDQLRILRALTSLSAEPHPPGCRKMSGHEDLYRIRVGLFRVIYQIDDDRIIITVLKLGHRKDIYR